LLVRADGTIESPDQANFPIGMLPDAQYEEAVIHIRSGDRLYLYSDGLPEQTNPSDVEFGLGRLCASVLATRELSLQESVDRLIEAVLTWAGREQLADDVTILAIECQRHEGRSVPD
jgi:sigma-B regulation protein RsbU (phosphoserine phosphatase)